MTLGFNQYGILQESSIKSKQDIHKGKWSHIVRDSGELKINHSLSYGFLNIR